MQKSLAARKERKAAILRKRQEASYRQYFNGAMSRYKRATKRIATELKVLENIIGSADFKMLKEVCTVITPEQKNEQGEVVQAEKRELNKQALLIEARNLIVLQREERIKQGLRKRTTGRTSKRKSHKAAVAFLLERNRQNATETTVETPTETV